MGCDHHNCALSPWLRGRRGAHMRTFAAALLTVVTEALPTPKTPIEYNTVEVSPGISLDVATAGRASKTSETLLLLHGYPECSWLWRGVVDPIIEAYSGRDLQLVMPDQRGFNHSSKPKGIGQYNAVSDIALQHSSCGTPPPSLALCGYDPTLCTFSSAELAGRRRGWAHQTCPGN